MRLINAKTIALEEFPNDSNPEYAILSHRWKDGEVTFKEMRKATRYPEVKNKAGYHKILNSCTQARLDKLNYVWIDTCCIDKDSSAELSEASNPMFRWYEKATVCYAFLSDVESVSGAAKMDQLEQSRWFTRGWTLQELIAPSELVFFDKWWKALGTKVELKSDLSRITGINDSLLSGQTRLSQYSISQRMCWASNRKTTRTEDMAYCLMGIFDVNMPMIYGEGKKAFIRLQEEIIKTSADQSIFASEQRDDDRTGSTDKLAPALLASSPAEFSTCKNITTLSKWASFYDFEPTPYSMANHGLEIQLPLIPWAMHSYLAILRCEHITSGPRTFIGIYLEMDAESGQLGRSAVEHHAMTKITYDRISAIKAAGMLKFDRTSKIIIPRIWTKSFRHPQYGFRLSSRPLKGVVDHPARLKIHSRGDWNREDMNLCLKPGMQGTVGALVFPKGLARWSYFLVIRLGFDVDFNPVCSLFSPASSGRKLWSNFQDNSAMLLESSWITEPGSWESGKAGTFIKGSEDCLFQYWFGAGDWFSLASLRVELYLIFKSTNRRSVWVEIPRLNGLRLLLDYRDMWHFKEFNAWVTQSLPSIAPTKSNC